MQNKLIDVFSKNRSEESVGEDNWAEFVVPPFINNLGIKSQSKAIVIIGGRGCGKTTLLRYFCHPTQFSAKRPDAKLPDDALSHIGLYWRADTNFLNSFVGGGQSDEVWRAAFDHLLACELGREIIYSIKNLNCNPAREEIYGGIDKVDLSSLQDFDPSLGGTLGDLEISIQKSRRLLSIWINNLDSAKKPIFLPANEFLRALISLIKKQLPYLSKSTYSVFIDEYENLRDEQQKFINGLLKHGSPPLIFSIAMKRNGWHTQETPGPESIQLTADYREIDIEEEIAADFDLFAAELVFFRLAEYRPELLGAIPIVPSDLRKVENINGRYHNDDYRKKVIDAAEKLLPRVNGRMASKLILEDSKLRSQLRSDMQSALNHRQSKLAPDDFISGKFPEATVIMPALIHREKEDPGELLLEFQDLKAGLEGRLSTNESLISNNLFGCVNSIYLNSGQPSILFSGFTSLTLISKGNIRYLLELIHRILKISNEFEYGICLEDLPSVSALSQAKAVKEASDMILGRVSGSGSYGPQLLSLVQCLGSIFREKHRSLSQSEPEVNHFTISGGTISEQLQIYLSEAEKWSILFVSSETKMKASGVISCDYVLNPIYSPSFQISFRKKRSLQLSSSELLTMLEGDQRDKDSLVRTKGKVILATQESLDFFGE